jgi:hypothetical protein
MKIKWNMHSIMKKILKCIKVHNKSNEVQFHRKVRTNHYEHYEKELQFDWPCKLEEYVQVTPYYYKTQSSSGPKWKPKHMPGPFIRHEVTWNHFSVVPSETNEVWNPEVKNIKNQVMTCMIVEIYPMPI